MFCALLGQISGECLQGHWSSGFILQRGRTAFMYALDRENGVLPVEIFQYMIKNGAEITQRDSVSTIWFWIGLRKSRHCVFNDKEQGVQHMRAGIESALGSVSWPAFGSLQARFLGPAHVTSCQLMVKG